MKRSLSLLLVFCLTMLLPAAPAAASPAPPAPAQASLYDEEDPDVWHCSAANPGPCPADGPNPWGYSGTKSSAGYFLPLDGKILCSGWTCSNIDVYIQINYHVAWSSVWSRTGTVRFQVQNYSATLLYDSGVLPCGGTGTSGECTGRIYTMVHTGDNDPDHGFHIRSIFQIGGMGTGDSESMEFDVLYSGDPIDVDKCDKDYQIGECLATDETIQATNETGVSVTGVEIGKTYRLAINGGPWNDGTIATRYDVAFSFDDGVTWETLDQLLARDFIKCIQNDPDNTALFVIFFEAETTHFKIRVNDTAGNFANNTGTMTFSMCEATYIGSLLCSGQFQYDVGEMLASGTVGASMWQGVDSGTTLTLDSWYVIVTEGGPWHDTPAGPDLYAMEIRSGNMGTWYPFSTYSMSNCMTTNGNYAVLYFQADKSNVYLRVNTLDDVWSNNSGSMSWKVYAAEYRRYIDTCETTFHIGEYLDGGLANAVQENGIAIRDEVFAPDSSEGGNTPPVIVRWYAFDTTLGPWLENGSFSYTGDFRKEPEDFTMVQEFPDAVCIAQLDMVGHYRIYFSGAKDYVWWYRVHDEDSNWSNNEGTLGWEIRKATNFNINDPTLPDDPTYCDSKFTYDPNTAASITFAASSSSGVYVPSMVPGPNNDQIYAIKTTLGPWIDNGDESYNVMLSDDNGATWHLIWEHDAVLCSQPIDDHHVLVYLKPAVGHLYKVRVFDHNSNFADNTGTMGITVYEASSSIGPWNNCSEDYTLTELPLSPPSNVIPANLANGKQVVGLVPGGSYAIEISGGPWTNQDTTTSYLAEAVRSGDWSEFRDISWSPCKVLVDPVLDKWRFYFTAVSAPPIFLRVHDIDEDWSDNTGSLTFKLYGATEGPTPPTPPNPPTPPTPSLACGAVCTQPALVDYMDISIIKKTIQGVSNSMVEIVYNVASAFMVFLGLGPLPELTESSFTTLQPTGMMIPIPNVGGWFDYVRCVFTSFIAWCPEHTTALFTIGNSLLAKDPFALFAEITGIGTFVQDEIDSYDWNTNATGGDEGQPDYLPAPTGPFDTLITGESTNPKTTAETIWSTLFPNQTMSGAWSGGPVIQWSQSVSWSALSHCSNFPLTQLLPGAMGTMVCTAYNFMFRTGWGAYVLLGMTILAAFFLVKYLLVYPSRFMDAVEGHLFKGTSMGRTGDEIKKDVERVRKYKSKL